MFPLKPIALALLMMNAGAIPEAAYALPILAETLNIEQLGSFDPSQYLISEKLDGIRAIWDGQTLRTRSGQMIMAPKWFLRKLPDRRLDGELWGANLSFEEISSAVRGSDPDAWLRLQYWVFDIPDLIGVFAERARELESVEQNDVLRVTQQHRVSTQAELRAIFAEVLAKGGEGLMLHWADAPISSGRSQHLLKLKPWEDDEATVIGFTEGTGQFKGMTGALVVRHADGRKFKLGSGLSKADRANPPMIGSRVTYRYRSLTSKGLPRFAVFLRVRPEE